MQPTHAKWEHVPLSSIPTNNLTNGHSPNMDIDSPQQPTIFPTVPSIICRNFTIIDTNFSSPPISNTGYPGPDGHVFDTSSGPNGLSSVTPDLVDELPEECRKAFLEARETEMRWKRGWGTEAQSCERVGLKVGINGYPV
jgi:chromatin structure-remodeling complex protein RSC7